MYKLNTHTHTRSAKRSARDRSQSVRTRANTAWQAHLSAFISGCIWGECSRMCLRCGMPRVSWRGLCWRFIAVIWNSNYVECAAGERTQARTHERTNARTHAKKISIDSIQFRQRRARRSSSTSASRRRRRRRQHTTSSMCDECDVRCVCCVRVSRVIDFALP